MQNHQADEKIPVLLIFCAAGFYTLRVQNSLSICMRIPEQYIYHNDRTYQYSEADGAYYPVPSQSEYRAQVAVIWISTVLAIIGILCYKYL